MKPSCRPVPGYEGVYAVDETGCVWRVGGYRTPTPRKLKPRRASNGYMCVGLSKDNKVRTISVHRIVAAAFHGPIPAGLDVCHLNHIRDDNRPENLCFGTRSENCQMSSQHYGSWRVGIKPAATKLEESQYVEIINRYAMGAMQKDIASEYGVTQGLISRIISGRIKCLKKI